MCFHYSTLVEMTSYGKDDEGLDFIGEIIYIIQEDSNGQTWKLDKVFSTVEISYDEDGTVFNNIKPEAMHEAHKYIKALENGKSTYPNMWHLVEEDIWEDYNDS